ncbi:beta-3 adrenergic receptor-like [Pocillopora damicornis]|nr:beta-3 adrenergic receptor-like [Pocillopora damicornis]
MANITAEDEANTVKTEILHYISSAPGGVSIFLAALNIVLAIVATLGNFLLLIALRKVISIYPPTKLFFRSLAVTDLFAGLIVQPMYSITLIPGISHKNLMYYSIQVTGISGSILCTVSILTSTAISVDRLLALLLGLRYKQVVTLKRTRAVVGCIWLLSCSMGGWR